MKPLALAGLVHSLFCDFDTALGEAGLLKTSKTDSSGGDEETGAARFSQSLAALSLARRMQGPTGGEDAAANHWETGCPRQNLSRARRRTQTTDRSRTKLENRAGARGQTGADN